MFASFGRFDRSQGQIKAEFDCLGLIASVHFGRYLILGFLGVVLDSLRSHNDACQYGHESQLVVVDLLQINGLCFTGVTLRYSNSSTTFCFGSMSFNFFYFISGLFRMLRISHLNRTGLCLHILVPIVCISQYILVTHTHTHTHTLTHTHTHTLTHTLTHTHTHTRRGMGLESDA